MNGRSLVTDLARFVDTYGPIGSPLRGDGAVGLLEESIARRVGSRYALAVSSGTAALAVALRSVGVGPGHEVITSTYDWGAATAATLAVGARPVFADIDASSALLGPQGVARCISGRTRAVIVTHLFGNPAPVPEIVAVVAARSIAVIEDGAQALGASLGAVQVGALGTVGCFSVGTGKAIDAGEGGLVVSDDPAVFEAAVAWSQHPFRQRLLGIRTTNDIGMNLRIHPIAAALAVVQLESLDATLSERRVQAEVLLARARTVADAQPVTLPAGARPSYHRLALSAAPGADRCRTIRELEVAGVIAASGPVRVPLHRRVPQAGPQEPCPAADRRCEQEEIVVNPVPAGDQDQGSSLAEETRPTAG